MLKSKLLLISKYKKIIFGALLIVGALLIFFEYQNVSQEKITSWESNQTADCGIVLTGGPGRVKEGFDLLSRSMIKKLIISGVFQSSQLKDIFPALPYFGELKEEDILIERRSTTTYGNSQQTLAIVEALGCRDVLLITSQPHMYRAYLTFKAAYPERIPIFKHAIGLNKASLEVSDYLDEALKSLFYSIWAY